MLLVRIFSSKIQLTVLMFPTIPDLCSGSDYMMIEGSCYRALEGNQNFFKAEIECQKDGAKLFSLTGNIKNNTIAAHVQYLTGELLFPIVMTSCP